MRLDGERIVGSRAIMRRLDAFAAEPPLLPPPGDPRHARVLEAERWGDEVLQSVPRRIIDAAFLRRPAAMESYAADAELPLPMRAAAPGDAADGAADGDQEQGPRRERARRRGGAAGRSSQRIDEWIAEGLLGGRAPERRRPADRLERSACCMSDRRRAPADRGAPGGRASPRYFPPLAGEVPAGVLPPAWLPQPARG